MKRVLSFLMVVMLLFSLIPALPGHAHAEELLADGAEQQSVEEDNVQICETSGEAVRYVKKMLTERIPEAVIRLPIEVYANTSLVGIYECLVKDTPSLRGDDSLRWQTAPYNCYTKVDAGYVYLHYSFLYLTDAQEEAELAAAMDALLAELGCDTAEEYATVKMVYQWICSNIAYVDNAGASLHDFTPYGALINRRATSQGFSLLIYELMRKLGIECRVIYGSSYGQEHFWNLVQIDEVNTYRYYLDAALDAGKTEYRWFLKGTERFSDHISDPEFSANNFYEAKYVEKEDFDRTPRYCERNGHSWKVGSCLEEVCCRNCGVKNGEYGEHDWNQISSNCERARVCGTCGEFIPPQPHTFRHESDTECIVCYQDRIVVCEGLTKRIYVSSYEETEEPVFYLSPGVSLTLVDEKESGYEHFWYYEVTLPGLGSYNATAWFSKTQDEEVFSFEVREHNYNMYTGECTRCDVMREDGHIHNWEYATCEIPMTCSDCGETYGDPLGHYFHTRDCVKTPAACTHCGIVSDSPMEHTYYSDASDQCSLCHRERIFGCTEGGGRITLPAFNPEVLRLVEGDPRVSVVSKRTYMDGVIPFCEFELAASEVGQYEICLENTETGDLYPYTLCVRTHDIIGEKCDYCDKTAEGVHFHKMQYATCTEPHTCTECGETSGEPLGHSFDKGPCDEPKTCSRCGEVVENPGHVFIELQGPGCIYCGRYPYTVCQGQGVNLIISSTEGGDFSLTGDDAGCSLVLLEYFVSKAVYYWEYMIYTPGPGTYEIDLAQKDSEETMGLTIQVTSHEFFLGSCLLCGTPEEGGHIHNWKSATCSRAAVCTLCGETEGTPLNHDFSDYACSEYATCARCGEKRGKVPHTYDDGGDDYCNVCNRLLLSACEDQKITIVLKSHESVGFILKEAPKGVYIKNTTYYVGANAIEHGYEIFTPGSDTYELVMQDVSTGELFKFTVRRYDHEFVDGGCIHCSKVVGTTHHHEWERATCGRPATCKTCGETAGEIPTHDFWGPTCTEPRSCCICGLVEAEPLGHDFLAWSCSAPAICKRCNIYQDHAAGHLYDGDGDTLCNRCGQLRTAGCPGQALEISFISETDKPFALLNPGKGISMTPVDCVDMGGEYIHSYRVSVPAAGTYELTARQEGKSEYETFTVQVIDHLFVDGFCSKCGAEFTGLPGDVDGNGKLDYNDALIVLRASINLATLTEEQRALADFDGNGKLDYNDALAILRASIGM